MESFVWGLVTGLAVASVVAVAIGMATHRRFVRLERRTLQAERLAELGTLTGGLAHEIKNPLSTVQLNLQLLQEDLDPENQAYGRVIHRMNTIRREVSRLKDILDDFLKYAGKLELDPRPTDLNEVLEDLADFYSPQAQQQRVQIRVRTPADRIIAKVDPKLLKQAILNLMINALQAMGEKGGELILGLSREGSKVRLDVIDTGLGIPAETASRIFDAYYSTKKGGTGLGLAMTRRIVEEHGGKIMVTSAEGKGSDFSIMLPG